MLVNSKKMLEEAKAGHYAVPAANIVNLENIKGVIEAAEETKHPLMVCLAEVHTPTLGIEEAAAIVKYYAEKSNQDIALHYDHGFTIELVKKAIDVGFTSVMIDGSSLPFEENVAKTKELIAICREKGMSIEAEVGSIGGEEDGVIGRGECADPKECKSVADLGVTMLAAGIGNIHGKYPENWEGLSFETLDAIQQLTGDMPLVLHGGTGIPDDMIKKAISLGVAKINVNTECQIAFAEATRKYIEDGKDLEGKGFDPRKLLAPGAEAIKDMVITKIKLFGSEGKADE